MTHMQQLNFLRIRTQRSHINSNQFLRSLQLQVNFVDRDDNIVLLFVLFSVWSTVNCVFVRLDYLVTHVRLGYGYEEKMRWKAIDEHQHIQGDTMPYLFIASVCFLRTQLRNLFICFSHLDNFF